MDEAAEEEEEEEEEAEDVRTVNCVLRSTGNVARLIDTFC
jgi:hypothetical protein